VYKYIYVYSYVQTTFSDEGDARKGLEYMVQWFLARNNSILEMVHFYLRLLFSLYVAQLLVFFYYLLFLGTTRRAQAEIERARTFVTCMPSYLVSVRTYVHICLHVHT
jgi:hypothetical protein